MTHCASYTKQEVALACCTLQALTLAKTIKVSLRLSPAVAQSAAINQTVTSRVASPMVALLPIAHYSQRQLGQSSTPLHPQRCEYTSKRCENPRAIKPNGDRHRLCEHHRLLANKNQRRWQNRRKQHLRLEQARVDLLQVREPAMRLLRIQAPISTQQWDKAAMPLLASISKTALPVEQNTSPIVLPRLRQHHVLSRALLQPVSPSASPLTQYLSHEHQSPQGIERSQQEDHRYEPATSFFIGRRQASSSYNKAMFQRS